MSGTTDEKAGKVGGGAKAGREDRLAQALRANLKRRKQAARAQAPAPGAESGSDEES